MSEATIDDRTAGANEARIDMVHELHAAIFGNSWARAASPKEVWAMLLGKVGDLQRVIEALSNTGDWGITWWDDEFEGWAASLHDTSACFCHAPDDLKCPKFCADPYNLTRQQAESLIALGVATVLS